MKDWYQNDLRFCSAEKFPNYPIRALGREMRPHEGKEKLWAGICFSKVPKLCGPISGATISITASQRQGSKTSNFLIWNPLIFFFYIKHMLKYQPFKTSELCELCFDWLLGHERFLGLSRNRHQGGIRTHDLCREIRSIAPTTCSFSGLVVSRWNNGDHNSKVMG